MAVRLGIPENLAGAPLPRRLAWLTGLRLGFLTIFLALVGVFFLRGEFGLGSVTVQTAVVTLGIAFGLAGVYAAVLRSGKHLNVLADTQLVLDQVTWTVIVYVSGGATSGATSFYGLSCLIGAILTGFRGATIAAVAGSCCYGGLILALRSGLLAPPADQPASLYVTTNDELLYSALVNFLGIVVVTLLSGYLAERLRMTGRQLAQAEERAEQAERMAALGRLAAGLAHEIRNPLGSISGSIELLRGAEDLSEEDRRLCDIVQREAARLDDLVSDMMALSRPKKPEKTIVDAVATVREVVELATSSGRSASDVEVIYEGPDAVQVSADGGQLRQLVWNLVRNAVQASGSGQSVRVTLDSGDDGAILAVEDRGPGIEPEARDRLFDAFFTTRSQGTGIGLAVVKRIADEHGFAVEVESEAGRGAVFRVHLGVDTAGVNVPSPAS